MRNTAGSNPAPSILPRCHNGTGPALKTGDGGNASLWVRIPLAAFCRHGTMVLQLPAKEPAVFRPVGSNPSVCVFAGMTERLKVSVPKTEGRLFPEGSNPSSGVKKASVIYCDTRFFD